MSVSGGTVVVEASGGVGVAGLGGPQPRLRRSRWTTAGPDEVRVEFESDDSKSEVRVRWNDGWDIEERED